MSETWVLNNTISGILPTDTTPFVDGNGTQYFGLWKKQTSLLYYTDENLDEFTVVYNNGAWTTEAHKNITFATSPTGALLTWLQSNGTKQETEPTFSFTHRYKSDNLIGTGAYKFRPYTLTQQTTLISFTINGTPYQAEDGMTWQQWVDSKYNTGSYVVYNGVITKMPAGAAGSRVTTDSAFNNAVSPTDIITATAYYMGQAN